MGIRRNKQPAISETALELARMAEQRLGQLALDRADVASGLDGIIEELTDRGRATLLMQLFEKMSPQEQYGTLAETFDNAELRAVLSEKHRIAAENAARDTAMERLYTDGRGNRRLELGNLLPGMVIQLNLHVVEDFAGAGDAEQLYESGVVPDWQLCLTQADGNAFRVLESQLSQFDNLAKRVPRTNLDLHDIVTLGVPNSTKSRLEPILHWGAPVWMGHQEDLSPIAITEGDLALGDVFVNNESIFL